MLPSLPPSSTRRYENAQETAAVRAAVQKALDDWKPGHIDFPAHHATVDLSRSDTKSFGETHASELSNIGHNDNPVPRPSTPNFSSGTSLHDPPVPAPVHVPAKVEFPFPSPNLATSPSVASPPLQPGSLNLSPVQLPAPTVTPSTTTTISPTSGSDPIDHPAKLPQVTPTVAETGVPKSAGPDGPGPASGSLLEVKAEHASHGGTPGQTIGTASKPYESAEDEKKRLAIEERERLLNQGPSTSTAAPKFETAEEEKKRLEREGREKLLAGGANPTSGPGGPDENEDELPPYKEF